MEKWLESLMAVSLDAAVLSLILCLVRDAGARGIRTRLTAAAFGIGFLLGVVSNVLMDGSRLVLMLFALGFMLSYTAFVFTFPEARKRHEGN